MLLWGGIVLKAEQDMLTPDLYGIFFSVAGRSAGFSLFSYVTTVCAI